MNENTYKNNKKIFIFMLINTIFYVSFFYDQKNLLLYDAMLKFFVWNYIIHELKYMTFLKIESLYYYSFSCERLDTFSNIWYCNSTQNKTSSNAQWIET